MQFADQSRCVAVSMKVRRGGGGGETIGMVPEETIAVGQTTDL